MPRKARTISSTGIYHIVLRSVNQHIIFEENQDYQKFLSLLLTCKTIFDIDIYAYCLMDNHIHLLLHSSSDNLSAFFQSFGSRFVRWYNNKYSRSGHLFQERFHSIAIENTRQYLATLIYIHNNPVKASVCRSPSEYRWSSYNAFYGEQNALTNLQYSYDIAGSKENLLKLFSADSTILEEDYFQNVHRSTKHYVPDEMALSIFKSVTHLSSTSDIVNLPRTTRNEYIRQLYGNGLTQKQIARFMDLSLVTIKRILHP